MERLASSKRVASVIARVEAAGREALRPWPDGALLLAPLSLEQVAEADDWSPQDLRTVVAVETFFTIGHRPTTSQKSVFVSPPCSDDEKPQDGVMVIPW